MCKLCKLNDDCMEEACMTLHQVTSACSCVPTRPDSHAARQIACSSIVSKVLASWTSSGWGSKCVVKKAAYTFANAQLTRLLSCRQLSEGQHALRRAPRRLCGNL
jgi:hypothetical protein